MRERSLTSNKPTDIRWKIREGQMSTIVMATTLHRRTTWTTSRYVAATEIEQSKAMQGRKENTQEVRKSDGVWEGPFNGKNGARG